MEARDVETVLHHLRVPEHREVVDDGVVLGERHVVGQPWPRHRDLDVPLQLPVGGQLAVVEVGRRQPVVEEQHLPGALVDLRVRRDPLGGEPSAEVGPPLRLEGARIVSVQVPAHPEAGQRLAAVDHHVGARRVLQPRTRSPPVLAPRRRRVLGHPRPQRLPGLTLRHERLGAHEPVGVAGLAVGEAHRVQHAVPVEGVVEADRRQERVLGVAQVDPGQVVGQLALDRQVPGVVLDVLGPPGARAVRMCVVLGQSRLEVVVHLGLHGCSPAASSTNETVVAVDPPMLSVAARRAPSTWCSPARPATCAAASTSIRMPVAPTG